MAKSGGKSGRLVNTVVLFAALVVIVVLVSALSTFVFARFDMTEANVNSLSPQSVETLRALGEKATQPIIVTVYISRQMPDSIKDDWGQAVLLRGLPQKLRDKLEEYRQAADGKLKVKEVMEDVETKAEEAGLQPFVADEATVKEGKLEMTRYVLGCTINYEGAEEVFEKALDPNFYEFEITKRLLRLQDRVENGRKIQHLIQAAKAIGEAMKECDAEVTAFEAKEDEKQEVSGVEGLLKPIENMEQEVEALAKNRERIAEKCGDVKRAYEARGAELKGQHKRFDAFLSGMGTENQVGGVEGYVAVLENLYQALAADPADPQQVLQLKQILTAIKKDCDDFRTQLEKAPGERKIGFVCGHGEFCPFAAEKPVFDPKIAAMMGQNNPIQQRFIEAALQLQEQIQQVLANIGEGLFRDKDFDVERVDATRPIADEVAAVVLFAPQEKLSEREMYVLDQFVMRGGTLVVLVDNFQVLLASFDEEEVAKMGPFNPNPNISNDHFDLRMNGNNMAEFLAPYGITVNHDLVLDGVNNSKVTLPHSVRKGRLIIRGTKDFDYPMLAYAKEFDRTNAMVRNLPGLTLPFASSLEVEEKAEEGREVSRLITSSAQAVSVLDPLSFLKDRSEGAANRLKLLPPELTETLAGLPAGQEGTKAGPLTLAVLVSGKLASAFAGKAVPAAPPKGADPEDPMPPKEDREPPKLEAGEGRILVVGSALGLPPLTLEGVFKDVGLDKIQQGEFLIPQVRFENWKIRVGQLRKPFGETIPALFNMLDWAVQRAGLAEIRAKNNAFRPIEKGEEGAQRLWTFGLVGGLPALFLLLGIGYWQVRVASRRSLARWARAQTGKGK